ncbi:MAG: hypothetical protein IKK59_08885 [Lachnospiraceae bacterium]|nr:hypothetical protein [Lachnospiraceae bacterium]
MVVIIYIIYAIIFGVCLINIIAPKWCWSTFESWKAHKEPSKMFFVVRRIEGIIGLIIITAIALAPTIIAYLNK